MATDTTRRRQQQGNSYAGTAVAIGAGVGLAAGLLANLARKAVVQSPTMLAGEWDEALAAEHEVALGCST